MEVVQGTELVIVICIRFLPSYCDDNIFCLSASLFGSAADRRVISPHSCIPEASSAQCADHSLITGLFSNCARLNNNAGHINLVLENSSLKHSRETRLMKITKQQHKPTPQQETQQKDIDFINQVLRSCWNFLFDFRLLFSYTFEAAILPETVSNLYPFKLT